YWFDLVWAGFILAADAVVWARAGRSLLHGGGWRLLAMFALSAPFWWAFEVANWRLENWRYVGAHIFSGPAQMPLKTLSFLFVLPALAESRDLLRSFVRFPDLPAIPLPGFPAPAQLHRLYPPRRGRAGAAAAPRGPRHGNPGGDVERGAPAVLAVPDPLC